MEALKFHALEGFRLGHLKIKGQHGTVLRANVGERDWNSKHVAKVCPIHVNQRRLINMQVGSLDHRLVETVDGKDEGGDRGKYGTPGTGPAAQRFPVVHPACPPLTNRWSPSSSMRHP